MIWAKDIASAIRERDCGDVGEQNIFLVKAWGSNGWVALTNWIGRVGELITQKFKVDPKYTPNPTQSMYTPLYRIRGRSMVKSSGRKELEQLKDCISAHGSHNV